jgi:hypothetical protein
MRASRARKRLGREREMPCWQYSRFWMRKKVGGVWIWRRGEGREASYTEYL